MEAVEVRRVLKAFGTQVTEFMDRRRELTGRAAAALESRDRAAVAAVLAALMTETSALHHRWLEVTNVVLEEERAAHSEMARLLEQAAEAPP